MILLKHPFFKAAKASADRLVPVITHRCYGMLGKDLRHAWAIGIIEHNVRKRLYKERGLRGKYLPDC